MVSEYTHRTDTLCPEKVVTVRGEQIRHWLEFPVARRTRRPAIAPTFSSKQRGNPLRIGPRVQRPKRC